VRTQLEYLGVIGMIVTVSLACMLSGCGESRVPLIEASGTGNLEEVNRLLAQGADVNAAGNLVGDTALMRASQEGRILVVQRLLEAGADVNAARKDGNTALMLASLMGHTVIVSMLLKSGANPNARTSRFMGKTALTYATDNDRKAVIQVLKQNGARE
jgi:uncharacterized protein